LVKIGAEDCYSGFSIGKERFGRASCLFYEFFVAFIQLDSP
jgi:hypothetical protein